MRYKVRAIALKIFLSFCFYLKGNEKKNRPSSFKTGSKNRDFSANRCQEQFKFKYQRLKKTPKERTSGE